MFGQRRKICATANALEEVVNLFALGLLLVRRQRRVRDRVHRQQQNVADMNHFRLLKVRRIIGVVVKLLRLSIHNGDIQLPHQHGFSGEFLGDFGTQVGGRHAGGFHLPFECFLRTEAFEQRLHLQISSLDPVGFVCLRGLLQQKLDLDELAEQLAFDLGQLPGRNGLAARGSGGLNPHYRLVQFTAFDFKTLALGNDRVTKQRGYRGLGVAVGRGGHKRVGGGVGGSGINARQCEQGRGERGREN